MPELPEVESLRRSLLPHLIGAKVTDAQLLRADVCESIDGHGRGHRTSAPDLLRGARIVELTRRGKQLSIIADDGRVLCVHLGMSGQLLVRHRNAALTNNHIHAYWLMKHADGSTTRLCFRDPRRFGGLWTFPSVDALLAHRWNALGPDALDITASHLHAAAAPSRRSSSISPFWPAWATSTPMRPSSRPASHRGSHLDPSASPLSNAWPPRFGRSLPKPSPAAGAPSEITRMPMETRVPRPSPTGSMAAAVCRAYGAVAALQKMKLLNGQQFGADNANEAQTNTPQLP